MGSVQGHAEESQTMTDLLHTAALICVVALLLTIVLMPSR
jgi:hypothetical protein